MSVGTSSIKKGETLIDTAMTLNAMRPDLLVVRHPSFRRRQPAVAEGRLRGDQCRRRPHEHPTQALLDALTIRRAFGNIAGCGRDLRRHPAQPRRALQHRLPQHDGRPVRLVGAADPDAAASTAGASRSSTTCARGWDATW
jgi:aspartate carbamoyltransferase catalytic subunit